MQQKITKKLYCISVTMDKNKMEKKKSKELKMLDLFCGCGGMALGFKSGGFEVHGVDILNVREIFKINKIGKTFTLDLKNNIIEGKYHVVAGGPPCKPWSSLNLKKRGHKHPDYGLLYNYLEHVIRLQPLIFILENVPPAAKDVQKAVLEFNIKNYYDVEIKIINYSEWGAAIKRKRMFAVGIRNDIGINARDFFIKLDKLKKKPLTVKDAISHYNFANDDPEHVYPHLKTIEKYEKYYKEGKYGWRILDWDQPAPSFGNIMKTYILHPDQQRVISIREALCIFGFPKEYIFPLGISKSLRYQMVADSVSPIFSCALAKVVKDII